ncbi:MAG: bifunctional nuclease family protein [Deltaproteobacteria bacterium]|jgi:bifunctional DNase/RNase|nr:bifunctional nuclease family protein [Deltaproteobacteria bacterium]
MDVEMQIERIALDPLTHMPIVMLKEAAGTRSLPIWIGLLEASSIATRLEKVEVARPLTHDLLRTVIEVLGASVERVTVVDLRESTFFASIALRLGDHVDHIDSRPSDALALAIRTGSPIFVAEQVFEKSRQVDATASADSTLDVSDQSKVAEFLENLPPDQFGKYKM